MSESNGRTDPGGTARLGGQTGDWKFSASDASSRIRLPCSGDGRADLRQDSRCRALSGSKAGAESDFRLATALLIAEARTVQTAHLLPAKLPASMTRGKDGSKFKSKRHGSTPKMQVVVAQFVSHQDTNWFR